MEAPQHRSATGNEGPIATVVNLSVCIAVRDLEASASWYGKTFGFAPILQREFPEYGARVAYLEANGVRIELVEDQTFTPLERPDPPQHCGLQGVSQLSFWVDDIEAVREGTQSRGIDVAMDIASVPDLGIRAFFIRDNDGNLIEFIEAAEARASA